MSLAGAWWRNICRPLDGLLWRNGINHGVIRPLLRNQLLVAGAAILAGAICYVIWPWLFWAACGYCAMTWIFLSWARFFLRADLAVYRGAILGAVIFKFVLRLLVLAVCLYVALRYFTAPAGAILTGFTIGAFFGLVNFAVYMRKGSM